MFKTIILGLISTAFATVMGCKSNTDCTDSTKPFCDSDGICKEPQCRAREDCKDRTRPYCLDFKCTAHECEQWYHCRGLKLRDPYCPNFKCAERPECRTNAHCSAKDPREPYCLDGQCRGNMCNFDEDCKKMGFKGPCEIFMGVARCSHVPRRTETPPVTPGPCTTHEQCRKLNIGKPFCQKDGQCVQCLAYWHCSGFTNFCNAGMCVNVKKDWRRWFK